MSEALQVKRPIYPLLGMILAVYVVGVPAESFQIFGASLPWVLLLIGNVVFLLYDFGLSSLVVLYYRRFHPLFGKWTKK